jgi:NTE family protein
MEDHWRAGNNDTVRSLRHKEILKLPTCPEGIQAFDLTEE